MKPVIDTSNPRWMMELKPDKIGQYSDEAIHDFFKKMPHVIAMVESPAVELQRRLLAVNSKLIAHINSLDEGLALEVLSKDPNLIKLIKEPTSMMISVAGICN
jgi:hypothetical protein